MIPTMTFLPYLDFRSTSSSLPSVLNGTAFSNPENSHDLVVCREYFLGLLLYTETTSSFSAIFSSIKKKKKNLSFFFNCNSKLKNK